MGKLADYMTHHSEIIEMKSVDENGNIIFQQVKPCSDEYIIIGDKFVSKDDKSLNVLDYKDYIISLDDMQFGTKDKNIIKEKMIFLYNDLKNIEFSDIRTEKIIIKKERQKDKEGNYILDTSKRELSFEKEMKFQKDNRGKDIKIRGIYEEAKKEWTGNYILTKQYIRPLETLNGAFFALHLNEEKHPRVHAWIPKACKMGNKYEAYRSAVRTVVEKHGFILQEDNVVFDKNDLKIEKNSKALNEYRAARQVLSAYSYILEEYQSLKGQKKSDFAMKVFKKNIVHCRKYKISVTATEHTEITNKQNKKQTVYSFDKLLKTYTEHSAGSQDFINQILERHIKINNLYSNFDAEDISKYTSKIEKEAKKVYENEGIKGIAKMLKSCISNNEKVPCFVKEVWRELASSDSLLKRTVAEYITEMYQTRATKQDDVDYEKLLNASGKINEIYDKYENLDKYEKVLIRFEELLKKETEKESNIINKLKDEFKLETLYIDKTDKTILRFGINDYEKVSIKEALKDKNTVYQVIAENKNKKQIKLFANEMQIAVEEVTNKVGGMVAKETISEIMKNKPFLKLSPLCQDNKTDEEHYTRLDTNTEKLCSIKERSMEYINENFSSDNIDKTSIVNPERFSSVIIDSILSACINVLEFAITIAKDFYENIMQKSEIYAERISIGNKILQKQEDSLEVTNTKEEKNINKLKEKIKNNDKKIEEVEREKFWESRDSGREER